MAHKGRHGSVRASVVDWSDSVLTDDELERRIEEELADVVESLKDGECSINLSGNRLQEASPLRLLTRRLREKGVHITTLRLHKNQLGDDAMNAIAEHIVLGGNAGQPLQELHLSGNRITEVGIRHLVEAAYECGVYAKSQVRALWLRTENQRPVIQDPLEVLERLSAENMSVCLLPSKESAPIKGGKNSKWSDLDLPVHMHHAFIPRHDQRAAAGVSQGQAQGQDGNGKAAKNLGGCGGTVAGTKTAADPKTMEWRPVEKESRGGKNDEKQKSNSKDSTEDRGRIGGKQLKESANDDWWVADAWAEDSKAESSSAKWRGPNSADRSGHADDSWASHTWEERPTSNRDQDRSRRGAPPPHDSRAGREWSQADHSEQSRGGSNRWLSSAGYGIGGGIAAQFASRSSQQFASNSAASAASSEPPPPKPQGGAIVPKGCSAAWLVRASNAVRYKVEACREHGLLRRSLAPSSAQDSQFQMIAYMGAQGISQACAERASVVVGSFVDDTGGLQELRHSCAGEAGLAAVFRHLRIKLLMAPGTLQDEWDDNQCASVLAAIYGELLDAPPGGESTAKGNARKVAEWALVDFVFLMGSTQLIGPTLFGVVLEDRNSLSRR